MTGDFASAAIAAVAAAAGAMVKASWDSLRSKQTADATIEAAKITDAAQVRAELWAEVEKLRDRMDDMQRELDAARRGYLELLSEHTSLKAQHKTLRFEHDALLRNYDALTLEVAARTAARMVAEGPHTPEVA